jgi:hypothetical protein
MGAKFTIHEVTLGKDDDTSEVEFRVKMPDGRMIGLFSTISEVKVYVPHGDINDGWTPGAGYEVVEVTIPRTMDDITEGCSKDDYDANGNFTVIAHHRH